ncbi:MAG: hypothetical protein D6675_13765 [Gemmatimonadetes bacterium]|nr:MAG: hypothetical protein D6675_13765 [Gemmatimonadota bacterium]
MTKFEERYDCPVCLGVKMDKLKVAPQATFLVDHCRRCGGMWFDQGEVQLLRQTSAKVLARKINLKPEAYQMQCHSCHTRMDRNLDKCPNCNWKNIINCPCCHQPLKPVEHSGLRLDICKTCKGVWFDQIELAQIWNIQLDHLAKRKKGVLTTAGEAGEEAAELFTEALIYDPFLTLIAVDTALDVGAAVGGTILDISGEAISNAPEMAGAVFEGGAELAGSIFEAIAEIIASLFE